MLQEGARGGIHDVPKPITAGVLLQAIEGPIQGGRDSKWMISIPDGAGQSTVDTTVAGPAVGVCGVVGGHVRHGGLGVVELLEGHAKFLRHEQLGPGPHTLKPGILARLHQLATLDILNGVVADKVMLDTLKGNADCLLDPALLPEVVRVDQGSDEGALQILVGQVRYAVGVGRGGGTPDGHVVGSRQDGRRDRLGLHVDVGSALLDAASSLRRSPLVPLESLLLLARREGAVQLAVDEEIIHDTAGAPVDAVGPPLDSGRVLLVDEVVAALDELGPLLVVGTAGDVEE